MARHSDIRNIGEEFYYNWEDMAEEIYRLRLELDEFEDELDNKD